jgi:membrane-associated PAP2 superfamily phosphatase
MRLPLITTALLACTMQLAPSLALASEKAAIDAMEAYLDFVDYGGATIFPELVDDNDRVQSTTTILSG